MRLSSFAVQVARLFASGPRLNACRGMPLAALSAPILRTARSAPKQAEASGVHQKMGERVRKSLKTYSRRDLGI